MVSETAGGAQEKTLLSFSVAAETVFTRACVPRCAALLCGPMQTVSDSQGGFSLYALQAGAQRVIVRAHGGQR